MSVNEHTKPDCYSPNYNEPPHERALRICGITKDNPEYRDYRVKFLCVITDLTTVRAHDVMDKVEGSIRQGGKVMKVRKKAGFAGPVPWILLKRWHNQSWVLKLCVANDILL